MNQNRGHEIKQLFRFVSPVHNNGMKTDPPPPQSTDDDPENARHVAHGLLRRQGIGFLKHKPQRISVDGEKVFE